MSQSVSSYSAYFLSRVMGLRILDLQAFCLFAALGLYGAFGSPTPDQFDVSYVVIAGLLIVAIGGAGMVSAVHFHWRAELWRSSVQVLMLYGIGAGVLGVLIYAQAVHLALRDLVAFGFLVLPLFLWPLVRDEIGKKALLFGMLTIGVLFSIRVMGDVLSIPLDQNALYYLGNSPAVLFTALFMIGLAFDHILRGFNVKHIAIFCACVGVAMIAVYPMVLSAQRASLGAVALFMVLMICFGFVKAPRRMVIVLMACIVLAYFVQGLVSDVWGDLQGKTALVGANMRLQEWAAVWGEITQDPWSFLFGRGFGANFSSPAVADIRVNYTHSLLSSMLLKLGMVGVLLTVFYLVVLGIGLMRVFRQKYWLVLALMAPLFIDVFFYAAYKSLDFGLLLSLIVIVGFGRERIASFDRVLYTKEVS